MPKLSRLLHLCGSYINAKYVVELGTSLGINTRYLAQISTSTKVHTLEGAEPIFQLAAEHLNELDNVDSQMGNIDELLPILIDQLPQIDLAYIDANHTYDATMRYYNLLVQKKLPSTIIVVGDIHWSSGMEKAWKEIIGREEVTLSVDLFHCGLLFFLPVTEKQEYIIWF